MMFSYLLDAYIPEVLDRCRVPGTAVAVVKDGKVYGNFIASINASVEVLIPWVKLHLNP